MLAEQAAQNAAEVEEAYGGVVRGIEPYGDEEWTGITPSSSGAGTGDPEHDVEAKRRECEYSYSDEEQLATVTVVEDFDPSPLHLLHGSVAPDERASPLPPAARGGRIENEAGSGAVRKRKDVSAKNKVRYETKAARKAAQAKQHARRTEKAERAGGKAARRTKAGGKKRKKIPMG